MRPFPHSLGPRLAGGAGLGLLLAAFLVLESFAFLPRVSDDGLYAYQAKRVAEGLVPYRDFFLAHPPLHVLFTTLVFVITGHSTVAAAKWIVLAGAAIQIVCAYLVLVRIAAHPGGWDQRSRSAWAHQALGLAAAAGLVLSQGFLTLSLNDTGVVQGSALVAAAAAALVFSRPLLGGLLAGLAPLCVLQTAPAVVVLLAGAVLARRWRPFLAGVGAVTLLGNGLGAIAAGRAFLEQVYLFHLDKPARPGEASAAFLAFLHDDWTLLTGAVLAGAWAAASRRRRDRAQTVALLCAALVVLHLLAVAIRPRVFPYYFLPALFPAAVGLALGLGEVGELWRRVRAGGPGARAAWLVPLGLPLAALLLVAPISVGRHLLWRQLAPARLSRPSPVGPPIWTDAPGIGRLNRVLRALFWKDGLRREPRAYNPVTEYLWGASGWLDSHARLAAAVRREKEALAEPSLFGDALTAPAVALSAGLPITADFADTNGQRFDAGRASFAAVRALLESSPGALVLVRQGEFGLHADAETMRFLAERYRLVERLVSRSGHGHLLFRRHFDAEHK
jgi:hypothetical protein